MSDRIYREFDATVGDALLAAGYERAAPGRYVRATDEGEDLVWCDVRKGSGAFSVFVGFTPAFLFVLRDFVPPDAELGAPATSYVGEKGIVPRPRWWPAKGERLTASLRRVGDVVVSSAEVWLAQLRDLSQFRKEIAPTAVLARALAAEHDGDSAGALSTFEEIMARQRLMQERALPISDEMQRMFDFVAARIAALKQPDPR